MIRRTCREDGDSRIHTGECRRRAEAYEGAEQSGESVMPERPRWDFFRSNLNLQYPILAPGHVTSAEKGNGKDRVRSIYKSSVPA